MPEFPNTPPYFSVMRCVAPFHCIHFSICLRVILFILYFYFHFYLHCKTILTKNVCLTITRIHYIFIANWMDLSLLILSHASTSTYRPHFYLSLYVCVCVSASRGSCMLIERYIVVPFIVCINIFMVRKRCYKHEHPAAHVYLSGLEFIDAIIYL